MSKLIDITGQRFNRLVVLCRDLNKGGKTCWLCLCDCGNETVVRKGNLQRGQTKSCGCLHQDTTVVHGLCKHPLYYIYYAMKNRCYNDKTKEFKDYGGRGIKVCNEWKNDFKIFYDWAIANGWKHGLHIDRIYNDGNYEPSNCQFVTPRESASNTRRKSKYGTGIRRTASGKFQCYASLNGKWQHLGNFDTPDEAKKHRKAILHQTMQEA